MRLAIPLAALCCAVAAAPAVAASLINFETDGAGNPLAPGTVIAEQYAPVGVHFVGSAFDEPGNPDDLFANNTDMRLTTAGGDTAALPNIPAGAGNFLHTYSGWIAENGDSNLAIVFDTPITSCSITFYDDTVGLTQMFAIEGDDILDDDQTVDSFDGPPQTLTVSSATPFTIVGVILGANNDWVAMDNVSYVTVPEPAVSSGLAVVAALIRRRRPAAS